jgi:hypothetical protein
VLRCPACGGEDRRALLGDDQHPLEVVEEDLLREKVVPVDEVDEFLRRRHRMVRRGGQDEGHAGHGLAPVRATVREGLTNHVYWLTTAVVRSTQ